MIASLIGLLSKHPYNDNAFVTAAWFGNDLVTLFVAAPLLAIACRGAARGSPGWTLAWLGMLDYVVYNFAFYVFGAALNRLFLLHEALLVGGAAALILGFASLDLEPFAPSRLSSARTRAAGAVSLFVAVGLGALWIAQSLAFAITGAVPSIVTATGGTTNVTAALDLMFVVPVMAAAGVLLARRRAWGVVLAAVAHVKGAAYMLVLALGSAVGHARGIPEVGAQIPIWLAIGALSAGTLIALLGPVRRARS